MKVVKSGLPMLGLVIATGCEFGTSNPPSPYELNSVDEGITPLADGNPKGSLYDAGFDLAGETVVDAGMAGDTVGDASTAGETTAGETTAGTE